MQVSRRFFPEILQENEITYFAQLEGILSSVDEFAILEITKCPSSYHFRLAPSLPKYTNSILQEILKFHNMFSIRLDLGKSIKNTSTITFNISLD